MIDVEDTLRSELHRLAPPTRAATGSRSSRAPAWGANEDVGGW